MSSNSPFSLYDFLGYLIPGFVMLTILYAFIFEDIDCFTSIDQIYVSIQDIDVSVFRGNKYICLITVIVFSYVLGTIVSYLSSIFIEQFATSKHYYPSVYLLSNVYDRPKYGWLPFKIYHFKQAGVVCSSRCCTCGSVNTINSSYISYNSVCVTSSLKKRTIGETFKEFIFYGFRNVNTSKPVFFKVKEYYSFQNKTKCLIKMAAIIFSRLFILFLLFPLLLMLFLFERIMGFEALYTQPAHIEIQKTVRVKLIKICRLSGIKAIFDRNDPLDYFRIIERYIANNSQNKNGSLTKSIDNYVAVYGFFRAMAFVGVVLFNLLVVKYLVTPILLLPFRDILFFLDYYSIDFGSLWIVLITILFVIYFFYMGFMKFYRRATLETYMVMSVYDI